MRTDFVGVTESFFKMQMQQYKQLLAIQIWCVSQHVNYSDMKKGISYQKETAERLSKFTYQWQTCTCKVQDKIMDELTLSQFSDSQSQRSSDPDQSQSDVGQNNDPLQKISKLSQSLE